MVFMMGLTACGSGSSSSSQQSSSEPTSSSQQSSGEDKTFKIGVCQLVQHDALDAATKGFVDTLKTEFGDKVDIDVQVASGDIAICNTQINKFVSSKKDLIMANATPALQAAAGATESIPILGTSITEYGVALGIPDFKGVTGFNVSGTSDLAPLEEQAQMLVDVFPNAKKVGLLYCSSEANSKYQVDVIEKELKAKGLETLVLKFSDSNDIAAVLNGNINKIDVLYIPTDNTAASNSGIIDNICSEHKMPVFAGEEGLCKGCGAITLTISYYNIGVKTGKMAIDILKNGADITQMEIAYDEHPVKKYNPTICSELKIEVPSGYIPVEQ